MRAARIAPVIAITYLAACGQASNRAAPSGSARDDSQTDGILDPRPTDALAALRTNRSVLITYRGASVNDCAEGRDQTGSAVRTCNVCAVILEADGSFGRQLRVERSLFNIAFRRAISRAQPDIAPTDASNGVWAGVISRESELPRTTVFISRPLASGDLSPLGMSIRNDDAVCLPSGMCVEPYSQPVLDILVSDRGEELVKSITGRCT